MEETITDLNLEFTLNNSTLESITHNQKSGDDDYLDLVLSSHEDQPSLLRLKITGEMVVLESTWFCSLPYQITSTRCTDVSLSWCTPEGEGPCIYFKNPPLIQEVNATFCPSNPAGEITYTLSIPKETK